MIFTTRYDPACSLSSGLRKPPRRAPGGPIELQDGPKMALGRPKTASRRLKKAPRRPHEAPKTAQEAPNRPPRPPGKPPGTILAPRSLPGASREPPGPLPGASREFFSDQLGLPNEPLMTPKQPQNRFQHAPTAKTMVRNFFQCSPTVFYRFGTSTPADSSRTPVRRTEALLIGSDHLASNNGHTFLIFLSAGLGALTTF